MRDDLDKDLLQLFEEKNQELPEEPFHAHLHRRIEKARNNYRRMYWILTALTLAACAALTNLIIDGVTLFGGQLTRVLQSAGEFLATPAGWAVMAVAALLLPLFRRNFLSQLM